MSKEIKSKEEILEKHRTWKREGMIGVTTTDIFGAMEEYAAQFRHDQFIPSNVEEAANGYTDKIVDALIKGELEAAIKEDLRDAFKAGAGYQSSLSSPV